MKPGPCSRIPMIKKLLPLILLLALLSACAGMGETLATTSPALEAAPLTTATLPAATATNTVPTALPAATVTASLTPDPPTPSPSTTPSPVPTATPATLTFAVIGDYGLAGLGEAAVAALVDSWEPALVVTTGDNNYPSGEAATIDENIGQYYAEYIHPYLGQYTTTTSLSDTNRFFPTLGNHDYDTTGALPYLNYFTLPGNERYYEFVHEPVHFFALNSDFNEPDGVRENSRQAQWLQEQLATSSAPWKIVYMHVPPYSSGHHGSGEWMRWPFEEWGATAVIAGHDHHYERLLVDDLVYFVNGLGGGAIYGFGEILPGSQARFTGSHGAMRVEAHPEEIRFEFITSSGEMVDSYTLTK